MSEGDPVALILGAGNSTGAAIADRFAQGGYTVCLARRNGEALGPLVERIQESAGTAQGYGCDLRDEDQVDGLVEHIEAEVGPIEVAVFNAGVNLWTSILDETADRYRGLWETDAFGGFLAGRALARAMAERGRGSIFFTGATASVRGGANFAAFAGAKHALRALAQSMARELGPKGIHVAHLVVDGIIDSEFIREELPQVYESKGKEGMIAPASIAEAYWFLHQQSPDAWTFELDLRPAAEAW